MQNVFAIDSSKEKWLQTAIRGMSIEQRDKFFAFSVSAIRMQPAYRMDYCRRSSFVSINRISPEFKFVCEMDSGPYQLKTLVDLVVNIDYANRETDFLVAEMAVAMYARKMLGAKRGFRKSTLRKVCLKWIMERTALSREIFSDADANVDSMLGALIARAKNISNVD